MRMPGTEEWRASVVKDVIKFDRSLARKSQSIAKLMGRPGRQNAEGPDDALFAFVHAAELAFATGQVEAGLRTCRDILKFAARKPTTSMQMALVATIGSIIGMSEVTFTPVGARVSGFGQETSISFEEQSTPFILELMRMLIAAWAAGRRFGDQKQLFSPEILPRGALRAAVLESAECRIVVNMNPQSRPRSQYGPVSRMIDSYSYRLDVMRSDREYWDQLIPQGDLIDWSLLAILVAIFRTSLWSDETREMTNGDGIFMRDLAKRIVQLT